jgi:Na+/H+-translocating membrane pyrophosphatase
MKRVFVTSVIALFIVLAIVFYWLRTIAPQYDFTVLMAGNVIMAAISFTTFFMVTKQLRGKPGAFVRGVYASSFLKLSVCVIAIVVYALVKRPDVHKPSLFMLFGIYAVYSAVETWLLSRLARETK